MSTPSLPPIPGLPAVQVSVGTGPFELGVQLVALYREMYASCPPDLKAEYWRMAFADLKEWREFCQSVWKLFGWTVPKP
jgi:hypothetical protein